MIDRSEWRQMPLPDRLAWLADSSDDSLLVETIRETLGKLADRDPDTFRARIADLEAEVKRLERLATAPTPY